MSNYHWILDHGHGINTKGKRSPVNNNGKVLYEYEFNRDVVIRLHRKLTEHKISHTIIAPEIEDTPLPIRVLRANKINPELNSIFLSVHANAHGDGTEWTKAHGAEVFYHPGSIKGKKIADIFLKCIIKETDFRDRGIKEAGFYILKNTKMPAILTENGFMTNETEQRLLLSSAFRKNIAEAHFKAILKIENEGL